MIDAVASWFRSRGGSQSLPGDDPEWDRLMTQLDGAMPGIEAGQTWLQEAGSSLGHYQKFLDDHLDVVLGLAPTLRHGVTNTWMSLIEEPAWQNRLQPHQIVLLLSAMQVWQIAAAERALKRQGVSVSDLNVSLSTRLLEEIVSYLRTQEVVDQVIADLRSQTMEANLLYPLAVDAFEPEETEPASELIAATSRFSQTEELEGFGGGLANTWKLMDVSTIALLYRGFGDRSRV